MLSGKTSLNTPKIRAGTSLGIWPCSFLCDYRRNQTAMKKKVLGPASTTPNSEILPTAWGIHVTKMKQDLVDDVYPDMMSMPLAGLMEDNVQIVTYLFRKTKTSDFFDGNIRTFKSRHRVTSKTPFLN